MATSELFRALQILKDINDAIKRHSNGMTIEKPVMLRRALQQAAQFIDEHRFETDQKPRL